MKCRFCNSELSSEFIDLGFAPPSNSYLTAAQLNEPEVYYPLKLFVCTKCFLVQVDEYKKADTIFSNDYAYFSSTSTSWLEHSRRYVDKMVTEYGINSNSFVIEIASNDGYLLQYFKERGIKVLGIEPAASVADAAINKGIETIKEFFGSGLAGKLRDEGLLADLILGNNVLAHVPDINDFVAGLKTALKPEGFITMEVPHLVQLIGNSQFDTIYHEHFSYLSFTTTCEIFRSHGLTVFNVEEISTHGGSLRIYSKHSDDHSRDIDKSVKELLEKEERKGIRTLGYYSGFKEKVEKIKLDFLTFLIDARESGKTVAAYGAAAKGNTLLNYCGVKNDLIGYVVDRAESKQGKYLPGSHIQVVTESHLIKRKPDYVIILPWNIKEEILEQLNYIKSWNGSFVLIIPELKVL